MTVHSFIRHEWKLLPIEVEVHLLSGIPQIQIMGQPDSVIKESTVRVKSALKAQGFQFPRAQMILVNLRPHYLKKQSRGLDLAIAFAILLATEQVPKPRWGGDRVFAYGELGLTGEVKAPEDLSDLFEHGKEISILTGSGPLMSDYSFLQINQLQELKNDLKPKRSNWQPSFERPEDFSELKVSLSVAQLIKIVVHGEHSTLFAGPAGSGKTTTAKMIHALLKEPDKDTFLLSQILSRLFGHHLKWRPFVAPHHSITAIGLLGGGTVPQPGEISRAHGGVLLLDELLEFSVKAQEGLREPFEQGEITIVRSGRCSIFPARSLILSTTNLCPCGKWVPQKVINCNRSARKCMAYLERLSGPLLDRFTILNFSHKWGSEKEIRVKDILDDLKQSQEFAMNSRREKTLSTQVNERLCVNKIERDIPAFVLKNLLPKFSSMRRRGSLLRVARTIADLEGKTEISEKIIKEAEYYTVQSFRDLTEERG